MSPPCAEGACSKSIHKVHAHAVRKKVKDKAFAANVARQEIVNGPEARRSGRTRMFVGILLLPSVCCCEHATICVVQSTTPQRNNIDVTYGGA
jgi:hypothetical protein